jgi:hypothetical protein
MRRSDAAWAPPGKGGLGATAGARFQRSGKHLLSRARPSLYYQPTVKIDPNAFKACSTPQQ